MKNHKRILEKKKKQEDVTVRQTHQSRYGGSLYSNINDLKNLRNQFKERDKLKGR